MNNRLQISNYLYFWIPTTVLYEYIHLIFCLATYYITCYTIIDNSTWNNYNTLLKLFFNLNYLNRFYFILIISNFILILLYKNNNIVSHTHTLWLVIYLNDKLAIWQFKIIWKFLKLSDNKIVIIIKKVIFLEYLINIICILQAKCITGQRLLHTVSTN